MYLSLSLADWLDSGVFGNDPAQRMFQQQLSSMFDPNGANPIRSHVLLHADTVRPQRLLTWFKANFVFLGPKDANG